MCIRDRPYLTGKETHYIYDAVNSGKISGNGKYTQKCQAFFESHYGFQKALLTTSCTDALEMSAMPVSYTHLDVYKRQVFILTKFFQIGISNF